MTNFESSGQLMGSNQPWATRALLEPNVAVLTHAARS